ncbi:MAG: radical SAM protein [Methanophagales archaeon]|nr:radical SAM protein [Methanophagales archaeon]
MALGEQIEINLETKIKNLVKQRFMLNENCFLIKGAKRGAIYDLKSGDVYSVGEEAKEILDRCEQGFPVSQIIQLFPKVGSQEIVEYLNQLETMGLGKFLKKGEIINKISLQPSESILDFLWLEITKRCNLSCVHCYANNNPTSFGEKLIIEDWEKVLKEAFDVGCRKVQFTGGEPFLAKELLFSLAKKIREIGYEEIEIFTNGTLLDGKAIQEISKLAIKVAVSFYSKDPKVHDLVTQKKGSYFKTLKGLKKLKRAGIPTRVAITVTKINQDTLFETINFLKQDVGIEAIGYDFVRPIGRGHDFRIFPDKFTREMERRKSVFPKINIDEFLRRIKGPNCFFKSMCITSSGEAIPCIMARDLILGNVLEESIQTIMKHPQAEAIRRLNKDKIETCKDCEYRYACFDCRPKTKGENGNLFAKPPECFYDPCSGIWKTKVEAKDERDKNLNNLLL